MTGLLAYLKNEYGPSVTQYFTEDCLSMQDNQKWDKSKGGIVNEDDAMLAQANKTASWWDEESIMGHKEVVVVYIPLEG